MWQTAGFFLFCVFYALTGYFMISFRLLGGAMEIGANCTYLNIDGTGIFIDAGLHPRRRDQAAFPDMDAIQDMPADALILTHAHTDHLGGLPYVLRQMPHIRLLTTPATRDLSSIMLGNTVKLIRHQLEPGLFAQQALELYDKKTVEYVSAVFDTADYGKQTELYGRYGNQPILCTFHDAGHILGSAGVLLEYNGISIFHTGDVQFRNQAILRGAAFPRHHVDLLFCECTNGAAELADTSYNDQKQKLAKFINTITNQNGSVLIPAFALGKTQEILTVLYSLMHKGSIPHLPIYTGGMSRKISSVYDRYCYTTPRVQPGFEISDIPQTDIPGEDLLNAPFFSTPSIVVASSGMMNQGTTSYKLASKWIQYRNFGIAFIGWQEPDSPGYALAHSEIKQPFEFGGAKLKRNCQVERFRFSAHAAAGDILDLIADMRPKNLVLMHGEPEACDAIADAASGLLPYSSRIIIPASNKEYWIENDSI